MLVIRVLRCTWKDLLDGMYQVRTSQGKPEKTYPMLFLYIFPILQGSYQPLLMFKTLLIDFRGALSIGTSALQ